MPKKDGISSRERKRNSKNKNNVYSSKHIRLQESLLAKITPKEPDNKKKEKK
jgi:hypothetical protein